MMRTLDEIAAELAALDAQRLAAEAALPDAEAALAAAEAALAAAQQVYDAAAADVVASRPGFDPFATTGLPSEAERAAQAAVQRAADEVLRQADRELGEALVQRTTAAQAVGRLQQTLRRVEQLTVQLEAERGQAQAAAGPGRDLLAGLRQRLGLGS